MRPCRTAGDHSNATVKTAVAAVLVLAVAACDPNSGATLTPIEGGPIAPGVAASEAPLVDQITVANRLMAAGEHELALDAFFRAAATEGLTAEILTGIGSANLELGRIDQAEAQLRDAIEKDESFTPAWNNLGVILMERGEYGEASRVFKTAFALDNGASDEIRSNLRLSLAKMEDARYNYVDNNEDDFDLVWQGNGSYLLVAPDQP
ncbi:MAG: tetratricopeptide repeat protein [Dinoroseobacter sp.]|nr:tetratricopeptide repeat protein [Dinoroseobacter sp.]